MVFLYHCLIVEDFDFYNLRIDLSRMAGIGKSDGFRFHKSCESVMGIRSIDVLK